MTPQEFGEYIDLVRDVKAQVPCIEHSDVKGFDGTGTLGELLSPRDHGRLTGAHDINEDARVLLYGYTTERFTFVVAFDEWDIIRIVDADKPIYETGELWEAWRLKPNKRAYPNRTDINFALLMAERNEEITFTTFP